MRQKWKLLNSYFHSSREFYEAQSDEVIGNDFAAYLLRHHLRTVDIEEIVKTYKYEAREKQ